MTVHTSLPAAILLLWCVAPATAAEPPDQPAVKRNRDGEPDARFMKRHEGFVADAKAAAGAELVLLGDFLTDDWRGNNKNGVAAIFQAAFGKYRPLNLGQGGDHTQHVLWRVQNGEFDVVRPKVVMLMIGGTNGSNGDDPAKIAAGVSAIIDTIQRKVPGVKILLLGVPPWVEKAGKLRARHTAVNPLLAKLDDGGRMVRYVDLTPKLLVADGSVSKDVMPDGVHLSDKGYQIWADAVAEPLAEMMR